MALLEEFEHSGNWLFRYRSYLPLLFFIVATILLIVSSAELSLVQEIGCLTISCIGLFIRALTIAFVPAGTSGRNTAQQMARSLNTKGIYSIVRHPLYLGNFFMWFGLSLATGHPLFSLFFLPLFWLYYERIMFAEEMFLRKTFDGEFLRWAEKTPAFFPRFSLWQKADLPASYKHIFRREYSGFFAFIFSFVYIHALRTQTLDIAPFWKGMLGFGLLVYIVLRTLKKKTSLLHVEGR